MTRRKKERRMVVRKGEWKETEEGIGEKKKGRERGREEEKGRKKGRMGRGRKGGKKGGRYGI